MKNLIRRLLPILVTLGITLAIVFTFAACNPKDDSKLYVGLECAYKPFNYTQFDDANGAAPIYNSNYKRADGYANGYDIMIARRIAEALGKELVVVKLEWDGLIPALNAGTVDLIIAGMSPTEERKQAIDFSDAYYQSNLVVVVRKDGSYASAQSLSDLSGAVLAAQANTFHDQALLEQGGAYGISRQTPLADFPALANALMTRAIDGFVAEEPTAIENCSANSDFTYIHLVNNVNGFSATDADVAIAVGMKKGNGMLPDINRALSEISEEDRAALMRLSISLASGANIEE